MVQYHMNWEEHRLQTDTYQTSGPDTLTINVHKYA